MSAYVALVTKKVLKSLADALAESPSELERLRIGPRFAHDLRERAPPMGITLLL